MGVSFFQKTNQKTRFPLKKTDPHSLPPPRRRHPPHHNKKSKQIPPPHNTPPPNKKAKQRTPETRPISVGFQGRGLAATQAFPLAPILHILWFLPFASEYCLFSSVGFKGNLSLLEICLFFPGALTKWKVWGRGRGLQLAWSEAFLGGSMTKNSVYLCFPGGFLLGLGCLCLPTDVMSFSEVWLHHSLLKFIVYLWFTVGFLLGLEFFFRLPYDSPGCQAFARFLWLGLGSQVGSQVFWLSY